MEQSATVDMGKFTKAQVVFERFRRDMQDDRDQAGAVQAFKVCYELALKMMKVVLATQGVEVSSPKDIFRKAFANKLIDNVDVWFDFQEKRNLTAYTYEQENLIVIVECFNSFSDELAKFIQHCDI